MTHIQRITNIYGTSAVEKYRESKGKIKAQGDKKMRNDIQENIKLYYKCIEKKKENDLQSRVGIRNINKMIYDRDETKNA